MSSQLIQQLKKSFYHCFKVFYKKLYFLIVVFLIIDLLLAGLAFWHYYLKVQGGSSDLPLVLRLNDVARVRARILYKAGYHTASQVKKENPYMLNQKTGLGINLCKKIIKKSKKKE